MTAGNKGFDRARMALCLILAAAICLGDMWLCFGRIRDTLPYPRHMDEEFIVQPALRILQTNDWNPHVFNYSSFPIYLVVGALSMGFIAHAERGEARTVDDIISVSYPFHDPMYVLFPARLLFALFMALAFAALGLAACRFFAIPEFLALVPFIGSLSMFLLHHAWRYINVDVLAACMAALTLAAVALHAGSSSFWLTALLPGALCGLTVAGKYTYFWILVPALLAIWLYGAPWRGYRSAALLLAAGVAFVCAAPYSILDIRNFVNELGALSHSYSSGRVGRTYEPGWDHARQYIVFALKDFGLWSPLLALPGMVYLFVRNWRGACILTAFPLLLFLHVSASRLCYERNVMYGYLHYAMLIGAGLAATHHLVYWLLGEGRLFALGKLPRFVIAVATAVILAALLLPLERPGQMLHAAPDTRNQAAEWLREHVPQGAVVMVPRDLGFAPARLTGHCRLHVADYELLTLESFAREAAAVGADYALMPVYGHRDEKGKAVAERKNRLRHALEALATFKGNPVGLVADYPVFHGDPALCIGRLKSPGVDDIETPTSP